MKSGRRPQNLRWFWSMTVNGPMMRSDRLGTLEEAKAIELRCLGARPTGQRVLAA
jgi:hypothetical protein